MVNAMTRRAFSAAVVCSLAGCSEGGDTMDELELTSPAFEHGDAIPEEYGRSGRNRSPPLDISDIPEESVSLALIVDDPDAEAVAGRVWVHWIVWAIPPETTSIPEGWEPDEDGAREGENDFGEVGYDGPDPPNDEHTYRFRLFALDTTPELPAGATAAELMEATDDHVIEEARLTGTYAPTG